MLNRTVVSLVHLKYGNRLVTCVIVMILLIPECAISASIPSHLASFAAELLKASKGKLKAEFGSSFRALIIKETYEALRKERMFNWGSENITQADLVPEIARALGTEKIEKGDSSKIQHIISAKSKTARIKALDKFYTSKGMSAPNQEQLKAIIKKLEAVLQASTKDLVRSYSFQSSVGGERQFTLEWKPEVSRFNIKVEGHRGKNREPFETIIQGKVMSEVAENGRDINISVVPGDELIQVMTSNDIKKREQGIFSKWLDQYGRVWVISPMRRKQNQDSTADKNLSLTNKNTALKKRIGEIRKSRIFLWKNNESGKTVKQQKFKRLSEPYDYLGEKYIVPDGKAEISRLEKEIKQLQNPKQLPVQKYNPVGHAENQSSEENESIFIKVTDAGGYSFSYDQAVRSGMKITARRTIKKAREVLIVPPDVVDQLIKSWNPPEWLELELKDDSESGKLNLQGQRWRLYVTYDGDTHKVKSIHTPYSSKLVLNSSDINVPQAVNSAGDNSDKDLSDEGCDTGNVIANGEPECTLRAAIEQANHDKGQDTIGFDIPGLGQHIIRLQSSLPAITDSLLINGLSQTRAASGTELSTTGPSIVLDGSSTPGAINGLDIQADNFTVKGLLIRGFGGNGIYAEAGSSLTASNIEVVKNCGWGILSEGPISLVGDGTEINKINNNGQGKGAHCVGGGILAEDDGSDHSVADTEIIGNNGPGILCRADDLDLIGVRINDNRGEGVDAFQANVDIREGEYSIIDNEINGNHGHGIDAANINFGGGVMSISNNQGWGIIGDEVQFGDNAHESQHRVDEGKSSRINNNGHGDDCIDWDISEWVKPTPNDPNSHGYTVIDGITHNKYKCIGGGILTKDDGSDHSVANTEIIGNNGPGILSRADNLDLIGVRINDNLGEGVDAFQANVDINEGNYSIIDNEINGNHGHGIDAANIDFRPGVMSISNNHGWGIIGEVVQFGNDANESQHRVDEGKPSRINNNGHGDDCIDWDISEWVKPTSNDPNSHGYTVIDGITHNKYTCIGGGILAKDDGSDAVIGHAVIDTEIIGNNGPGILSNADVLTLIGVRINDNLGDGVRVVSGSIQLSQGRYQIKKNEISGNRGDGVFSGLNDVKVLDGLINIISNCGWGIYVDYGDVKIHAEPENAKIYQPENMINSNGDSRNHKPCIYWDLDEHDAASYKLEKRQGGGVFIDGSLSASALTIMNNHGDGIRASSSVTLSNSKVCLNDGKNILTPEPAHLKNVIEQCEK